MDNNKELNKQTIKEVEKARAEIKAGKFYTLSQVEKQLGLDVSDE